MKDKNQDRQLFVVGVDLHPDEFTAVAFSGTTALDYEHVWTHSSVEMGTWAKWLCRHVPKGAILVVEAGCNTSEYAAVANRLGYDTCVLESKRVGQIANRYCKVDKGDAAKLAMVYFTGLAPKVWQPNEVTRIRREVFSAYEQATTETTRLCNQIKSYLTGHGIRLKSRPLPDKETQRWILEKAASWDPSQRLLLKTKLESYNQAGEHRATLKNHISQEVLKDKHMRTLIKLCGIRAISAYGLAAAIGDINRFATAKKLVAYLGLCPNVNNSGSSARHGGVTSFGRRNIRALLTQGAHSVLKSKSNSSKSFREWGHKLAMRRGKYKSITAVARKLAVAVWYAMRGMLPVKGISKTEMETKLKVFAREISLPVLRGMGYKSTRQFIDEYLQIFELTG